MKYEKHAYLFELICNKFDGAELGKKAAQKLFYFFERQGITLNLRYGIHYYGPYSEKLDNIMYYLESENVINIDDSGRTPAIRVFKRLGLIHALPVMGQMMIKNVPYR